MLRLQRHRAFWYLYLSDKVLSEGMYEKQAKELLAKEISLCYSASNQT